MDCCCYNTCYLFSQADESVFHRSRSWARTLCSSLAPLETTSPTGSLAAHWTRSKRRRAKPTPMTSSSCWRKATTQVNCCTCPSGCFTGCVNEDSDECGEQDFYYIFLSFYVFGRLFRTTLKETRDNLNKCSLHFQTLLSLELTSKHHFFLYLFFLLMELIFNTNLFSFYIIVSQRWVKAVASYPRARSSGSPLLELWSESHRSSFWTK